MGRRDCKWPCIFFAIFPGLVICSEEWQVWRCSHFVSEPQEAGAFHYGALECHYSVNNLNQLSSLAVERGSAERSPAVCPAQLRPVMKMNVEITSGTGMSWLSWLCSKLQTYRTVSRSRKTPTHNNEAKVELAYSAERLVSTTY